MAVLKGVSRSKRSESLSKGLMVDTVRGQIRVRKWPRKRGTPKSALQRWWNDWFTQANRLAKYVDAATARRAIQLTAGSGMYPRDIILSAMRGRLYHWVDQNGKKWRSMAAIQDISDSLDILVQDVGSVLVRATDRWRAPPVATIGDVLAYQGASAPPIWLTPAGGGGYIGGALVSKIGNQSIPNAAVTPLTFDTEQYDTHVIHDNVTNNDRLIVPTGYNRVALNFNCELAAAGGGFRQISLQKNGLNIPGGGAERRYYDAATAPFMNASTPPLVVVPTDYFTAIIYQNSGGALNCVASANTWFSMTLLSEI